MDTVKDVLSVAQAIYAQCERVKCCKCQSRRLAERVQILMQPIETFQAQPTTTASPQLEEMLQKLLSSLEKAKRLLVKYSHKNWLQKFLKASEALEEFSSVNEHLGDAAEGLSLLLQVEQTFKESFQRDVLSRENYQDFEADRVSWEEMRKNSKEVRDGVDNIWCGVTQIQSKLDEVLQKLDASRQRTTIVDVEITEIEKRLLTKWTFLKEFKSHVLYKGEYHKSPVAIKVFKNPVVTSTQKVRDLFRKEIKAMKRFESPHILRMYGICIDESGSRPEFSMVTEYCEKGTLWDVLRNEPDLPWKMRIQMALHAAIGLYRLHHTGDKSQLHGCINSNKFLVAEGYNVKLSGFELSQTESSFRRKPERSQKEVSPSAYVSPQGLASVNHIYDLPSEIYSFGIVLWEIITGKIPFRGCTSQEIQQKVYKEGYQEPLGDCPSDLREVINQCRNFQPSKRPTAEAIVDSLLTITSTTTDLFTDVKTT